MGPFVHGIREGFVKQWQNTTEVPFSTYSGGLEGLFGGLLQNLS